MPRQPIPTGLLLIITPSYNSFIRVINSAEKRLETPILTQNRLKGREWRGSESLARLKTNTYK